VDLGGGGFPTSKARVRVRVRVRGRVGVRVRVSTQAMFSRLILSVLTPPSKLRLTPPLLS